MTRQPAYLCFDVGGTRIKGGLIAPDGRVLARQTVPTEGSRGASHVLRVIRELGERLLKEVGTPPDLAGVGIAMTGVIDPERNVVVQLNGKIPGIEGMPMGQLLAEHFQVPVHMENDSLVYTLGEWRFGAGRGVDNLVCITLGTGVGTGVVINGRLLRTRHLLAGILGGHFTVDPDGPTCSCGNVGCLETFASVTALVQDVRWHLQRGCRSTLLAQYERSPDSVDAPAILKAVSEGDELATERWRRYTRYVGVGIVNLIHAYDPELVVIGGGISSVGPLLIDPVREYVKRFAWTEPRGRVDVRPAQLQDDAALLGGLVLCGGGA